MFVSVESGDASASEVNLNLESVSISRVGCLTGGGSTPCGRGTQVHVLETAKLEF